MDLNGLLSEWGLKQNEIEGVLRLALKKGGQFSELFFEETSATALSLENGKVDHIQEGVDRGVGLRVIRGDRSIYGYTTNISIDSLSELAKDLAVGAELSASTQEVSPVIPKDWRESHSKSMEIENYQVKERMDEISLKEKVQILKKIDQGARSALPTAIQVTAIARDAQRKIFIINSQGEFGKHLKHYFQMVGLVVGTKEGRLESAHSVVGGFSGKELLKEKSPESIGKEAALRVKTLLSALPAPSGALPVVMSSEAGGTMIHEAVGHGLEADLACNGLSVYQNQLGKKVANPKVSVIDDGTIPALRGSYSVDDEGTPAQKNILIEDGVLKGYMVDRLSAMKFDLMATGNGRRESFRHKPIVRMTNTYIAPGKDDPKKILENTPKGIFIKSMGGGQVNTVSGDFVFSVTEGYLIEGGKLGRPIRGATLVGNGPKVLQMIDQVGTDLDFQPGTCGKDGQAAPVTSAQPTIRIKELIIGGEVPASQYFDK